jgi:glutamate synthase domain-containing protein 2
VLKKLEVFLDGGLRDGNDILKALCLGATAVGVGRPFLYALGAYGTKGVERCVDSKWKFTIALVELPANIPQSFPKSCRPACACSV